VTTPQRSYGTSGLRCDLVRGYVISKPKPADQLELGRYEFPALAVRRAA
jgi:hypothetical protein